MAMLRTVTRAFSTLNRVDLVLLLATLCLFAISFYFLERIIKMASVKFTVNVTVTPAPLVAVSDPLVLSGAADIAFTASLQSNVRGGTPPDVFAITNGTLPAGLTMDSSGNISGTPTSSGTSTFEVTVTDAGA